MSNVGTELDRAGTSLTEVYRRNDDVVEAAIRKLDKPVVEATGTSLFHILTLASIGGSIALYASGQKSLGIFIGLWAPTFQALKAAAESKKREDIY